MNWRELVHKRLLNNHWRSILVCTQCVARTHEHAQTVPCTLYLDALDADGGDELRKDPGVAFDSAPVCHVSLVLGARFVGDPESNTPEPGF